MTKPIFKRHKGRPPELQLKVLKLLVMSGQLSKKKVAEILPANYPDISDSMDALKEKGVILFSEKHHTSGRNPEKFYKITEKGLRSLLEIQLNEDEFWRTIILLSIFSKKPVDEAEFKSYFHKFEYKSLGHFNVSGYFFLISLFDDILCKWMGANGNPHSISVFQKIIECLAFNGPSNIQDLVNETKISEKGLLKILNNRPLQADIHLNSTSTNSRSDINISRKKPYSKTVLHLLISKRESKKGLVYELNLFGIMLVLAIITYYFNHREIDSGIVSYRGPELLYCSIDLKQYFDKVALNYKTKIPLIFGKWDFLKSHLGVMLYDSFDFLLFMERRSKIIYETIWFSGTREFYDDIQILTYTALFKLRLMYLSGTEILRGFENRQRWITSDPRLIPVRNKFREIKEILKYADVSNTLQEFKSRKPFRDLFNDARSDVIGNGHTNYIENMFRDELTFLFYLSLNTNILSKSYSQPSVRSSAKNGKIVIPYETREVFKLGGPQDRLMAILAEDKDISQWFSSLIAGIIEYRHLTSNKMSEFYDQITNASNYHKERKVESNARGKPVPGAFLYEEDDVTRICHTKSESIYDYSTLEMNNF